jgi:hypothetical protein
MIPSFLFFSKVLFTCHIIRRYSVWATDNFYTS